MLVSTMPYKEEEGEASPVSTFAEGNVRVFRKFTNLQTSFFDDK